MLTKIRGILVNILGLQILFALLLFKNPPLLPYFSTLILHIITKLVDIPPLRVVLPGLLLHFTDLVTDILSFSLTFIGF
jgi:hypothetical protein